MVIIFDLAPVVLNLIERIMSGRMRDEELLFGRDCKKPAPRSEIGKEAIAKWNCVREEFDGSPTRCVRNMCSTM
jgi:hypothetical protein